MSDFPQERSIQVGRTYEGSDRRRKRVERIAPCSASTDGVAVTWTEPGRDGYGMWSLSGFAAWTVEELSDG